jgi:hypothetical protein
MRRGWATDVAVEMLRVLQNLSGNLRAVLSSEACRALKYFATLSHKRYDFRKKVMNENMCVDFL